MDKLIKKTIIYFQKIFIDMKERPKDLNLLAKQIFVDNTVKGFHDKEYSDEHYLMLVITELSEAVNADRLNRKADLNSFDRYMELVWTLEDCFLREIKDTIDEKLADAVIRLLDLAGLREIDFCVRDYESYSKYKKYSFWEAIFYVTILLSKYYRPHQLAHIIKEAIWEIEDLCQQYNIDLWRIVELKLEYNKLRFHKHGKGY